MQQGWAHRLPLLTGRRGELVPMPPPGRLAIVVRSSKDDDDGISRTTLVIASVVETMAKADGNIIVVTKRLTRLRSANFFMFFLG